MADSSSAFGIPIRTGDVLASKYEVERVLGSGGMGVVVAARHLELGQRVALKFLLPHVAQNETATARFLREARAAVKVDSEHVARVLDVGRLDTGLPFLVMEYLEGHDLSQHPRGEALPITEAVELVLQACAGMAVAHAVGIVHRDLKPANLFLTLRPDGSLLLKVLDFGVSKLSLIDSSSVLTQASAFIGSPLYMSPEQADDARDVDARTDIWSLGVLLYELLSGVPPFDGRTMTELLAALVTRTPRPLRELRPEVPAGLEQVVLRALAKQRELRFADVGAFASALVAFAPRHARVLEQRAVGALSRAASASFAPPTSLTIPPDSDPTVREAPPTFDGQSSTAAGVDGPRSAARRRLFARPQVLLGLTATCGILAFALQRWATPTPVADATPIAARTLVSAEPTARPAEPVVETESLSATARAMPSSEAAVGSGNVVAAVPAPVAAPSARRPRLPTASRPSARVRPAPVSYAPEPPAPGFVAPGDDLTRAPRKPPRSLDAENPFVNNKAPGSAP